MDATTAINHFLSWELYLQVAIPSGYLGYVLSRLGISYKDQTTTIIFKTLVFSLLAIFAWGIVETFSIFWAIAFTVFTPIFAGILWRYCLHERTMSFFHWTGIANSTNFPDVWSGITQNRKVGFSQITVHLKSGEALSCDYLFDYDHAPISQFRSDKEGNIALYVSNKKAIGSNRFEDVNEVIETIDNVKFYRLTYIPKEEIEKIEFVINHPL